MSLCVPPRSRAPVRLPARMPSLSHPPWSPQWLCESPRGPRGVLPGARCRAAPGLTVCVSAGADHIRKYWSRYYQGSQGVVFVLDSASSEGDLETARNELHSALQHPQLCTLPFLILASHQDKPAARSAQEVRPGDPRALSVCCLGLASRSGVSVVHAHRQGARPADVGFLHAGPCWQAAPR